MRTNKKFGKCQIKIVFTVCTFRLIIFHKISFDLKMFTVESRILRKILFSIVADKKCDKIQTKMHHQIEDMVKDWNDTISNYVNTISKLFELIQMAERHMRVNEISGELHSFNKLTKTAVELCNKFYDFIRFTVPDSAISIGEYLNVISKANSQLQDIREMLSSILIISSHREIIENVREVKSKMEEIQSQMKIIHTQITDCTENVLK